MSRVTLFATTIIVSTLLIAGSMAYGTAADYADAQPLTPVTVWNNFHIMAANRTAAHEHFELNGQTYEKTHCLDNGGLFDKRRIYIWVKQNNWHC